MKKLIFIIYMLFDSFVFLVFVGVLITSFVLPRITIFLASKPFERRAIRTVWNEQE